MHGLASTFSRPLAATIVASLLIGCSHEKTTDFRRADFTSRKALKSQHSGWNELADSDVLGAAAANPTDEDIRNTLDRANKVELKRGETVLVVQSGQSVPDARLVSKLSEHFRAIPFSGVRSEWPVGEANNNPDFYAKSLRLAAAQAGAEKILCWWGSLEVARHDLATKTITWLPVVDVIVPDQKDHVRVHLKMALVDVRSGAWTVFRTEPVETEVISTGWGREHVETPEIKRLKEKSYVVAVNSLTGTK